MIGSATRSAGCRLVPLAALLLAAALLLPAAAAVFSGTALAQASSVRLDDEQPSGPGPTDGGVPGNTLGNLSNSDVWREIRHGIEGRVSIPDAKAGVMVQSGGEQWRNIRNGPLQTYTGWALLGTVVLLAAFFALRGRIRIEHGRAGLTIERFKAVERFGHWLIAISFILLALTGLNILYGRAVLIPLLGKEAFALIAAWGKLVHNFVSFAFMGGLILVFLMWVAHNLPSFNDLRWLARGGGLLSRHSHPPARKFNAGQKIIFWSVIIGGLSLSLSGWALLFPFETHFFTDSFLWLSGIGIDVPAWLGLPDPPYALVMEQQLNQLWHGIVAAIMMCIILAHIYIGSVGMQGAFAAMGSGQVDRNWALEHHSLWVEEVEAERRRADEIRRLAEPAE